MDILSCTPRLLVFDKNSEKEVGDELWLFPPILGGEKFILNHNASMVYELCKEQKSVGQILETFREKYPEVSSDMLLNDITKILKTFWIYQLITWDTNPFSNYYRIYSKEIPNIHIEKLVYDNFPAFFGTNLKYNYRSPYVKQEAIEKKELVEKQILEGSMIGFTLYNNDNEKMTLKMLLRFDKSNKIADILYFDFDSPAISKQVLNWFMQEVKKNIFKLWSVNEKKIVYTIPFTSENLNDAYIKMLFKMNFKKDGYLKKECESGDVIMYSKLLVV